jgi:hypothetical protein
MYYHIFSLIRGGNHATFHLVPEFLLYIFFGGLECVAHFVLLGDVWNLDSNPESCRSKQVHYQLTYLPTTNLVSHLLT